MPDQAPQALDELLDSDELYEPDWWDGHTVNKDYAKAALTALIEREKEQARQEGRNEVLDALEVWNGSDERVTETVTDFIAAQRKEDKKGEN